MAAAAALCPSNSNDVRDNTAEDHRRLATESVMVDHMWLARTIANRYRGRGVDFEDLFQVACVGLVEAARRFDPDRGDFITFAVPTIAGVVKRHFRDHGWLIRPPRRTQELVVRIRREWSGVAQELGHIPTDEQLAERLGETAADIEHARYAGKGYRPLSIDALTDGHDRLEVSNGPEVDRVEAQVVVQRAMRELTDEDRRLVRMRFYEGRSQSEIAQRLGTSQMQVSRRLATLFARMRPLIGVDDPSPIAA